MSCHRGGYLVFFEMKSRTDPIHVWVPGIREGSGGIQAFSRIYLQALREAYPAMPLRVFVKNDEPEMDDLLRTMGVQFHSVARFPAALRTLVLVLCGWYYGMRDRPCCSVTTHLHFLPALCLFRSFSGIPCASVLHGIEAWNISSWIRLRALRSADHLIAVSEFTREHVVNRFGVSAGRVSVVPNTFDTERFSPGEKPDYLLERYGLVSGQPVLMTVSRLALSERYKGHRQVLAALPEVRRQFPDIRYVIVGSGDDVDGIREAVSARGLEDCVIFAGHIPVNELPDHYRLCDVFVMPSSKEGFGIVFLEAMASGKPVLAGCVDGSVDAVGGGRFSPLVDPNDVSRIGEGILNLLRRDPPDALWFDPKALSGAVSAEFGYERVSRLMAQDFARAVTGGALVSALEAQNNPLDVAASSAPKVLVIVNSMVLPRVEFFNAVSAIGGFNLEVVYLTNAVLDSEPVQHEIAYNRVIFSKNPSIRSDVMQAIRSADLVVFGIQSTRFTAWARRERTSSGKAWVMWLGLPDAESGGLVGRVRRWLGLDWQQRFSVPIWANKVECLESIKKEFGGSRVCRYVPHPLSGSDPENKGESYEEKGSILNENVQRFSEAVGDATARWQARSGAITSF